MEKLLIKKIYPDAVLPKYATDGSNCFDLHAYIKEPVRLFPGQSVMIESGLAFGIPKDHVLVVHSRSGHGHKHRIRLSNSAGIIDSDYVNQVFIPVCNDSQSSLPEPYVINPGDRIAQVMMLYAPQVEFEEVDTLEVTTRTGGFGSTGA